VRGRPARAEEGTVALSLGNLTLVIDQDDVVGTERDGEHFVVSTREGARVLARIEATGEIRRAVRRGPLTGCGCTGTDQSSSTVAGKHAYDILLPGYVQVCDTICVDVAVDEGDRTEVITMCLPVNCRIETPMSYPE
jgi:hypothetical protein